VNTTECSVAALLADGLQLADAPVRAIVEHLQWQPVRVDSMPLDHDRVVIIFSHGCRTHWDTAYWDAEGLGDLTDQPKWRFCESGGEVPGRVLWWAVPQGPKVLVDGREVNAK
jgi:hypothetical protein